MLVWLNIYEKIDDRESAEHKIISMTRHLLLPWIIVYILWKDVGEIKSVVHGLLTSFIVAGWCHVTSTPPTSSVVFVGRRVTGQNIWVGSKPRVFPIGNVAVHHVPTDHLCHPHWNPLTPIVSEGVSSVGVWREMWHWCTISADRF